MMATVQFIKNVFHASRALSRVLHLPKLQKNTKIRYNCTAHFFQVIEESFANIETIASFNRESECFVKYHEAATAMHRYICVYNIVIHRI